jgi:aspartate kinase
MALVVHKYGGTSVGTVERIQAVAHRIQTTVRAGNDVVVVVSAMGHTTDELVKLAQAITDQPCRREMDMLLSTGEQVSIALLSMALQTLGQPAVSMTGAQVGIFTEAHHSRARILAIEPERILTQLRLGNVVVVAGFQGIASQGTADHFEITTLGRGGSDTSAVALAAALGADRCEIYTDVPGILTTDPRLVPEAHLMDEVTSDEMLELASLGASVLHPRAVEIARNYGVPLVVRSSWTAAPGTWVRSPRPKPRPLEGLEIAGPVDGIELDTDQAKVALLHVPDRPGVAAQLFGAIATEPVNVDLIIQSIHDGNTNDIAFTVRQADLAGANRVCGELLPVLSQGSLSEEPPAVLTEQAIAKVSIAGAGMIGRPGVAAQMFSALAEAGVNIQMISTSEVKVSCVIAATDAERAIARLCSTFEIELATVLRNPRGALNSAPAVRGVALDRDQARLAIRNVPDVPGMAARIFQLLADHQISVDMIIQSQRCRELEGDRCRDIACTLALGDADQAEYLLQRLLPQMNFGQVVVERDIAKVSVVGAGMVNQPGVAARMFEALSSQGINILMIATSEIKISCVVKESEAVAALKTIHAAFELAGEEKIGVPA